MNFQPGDWIRLIGDVSAGKEGESVDSQTPLVLEDVKDIDDITLRGPEHRGAADTIRSTAHDSLLKAGYEFRRTPGERLYKCPDCHALYNSLQDAWHHFVM